MSAILKIIIGIILVLAGLYALAPGTTVQGIPSGFALDDLWTVLKGSVPVLVILFGLLLVWIESEELKTEKEFKRKKR